MNPILGFIGGLAARLTGYAAGIATEAIFEAFGSFNPFIPLLGFVFAVVTFFAGIAENVAAGLFFSFGIMVMGGLLHDFGTIVSGLISLVGIVVSLLKSEGIGL
jgi:hypothetical protein